MLARSTLCFLVLSIILMGLASQVSGRGGRGGGGGGGRGGGGRGGGRGGGWGSSRGSSRGSGWGRSSGSGSSYPRQHWSKGGKAKGFTNPKLSSYGSSLGGANTQSYRSPGYGTAFGTNFRGGVGQYGGREFGSKKLGLGVGAGYLGGAALGRTGSLATLGVYHRYIQYRLLLGSLGHHNYYHNNYYHNHCQYGCPLHSHCEWGFCECNPGYEKRFGQCEADWSNAKLSKEHDFNSGIQLSCSSHAFCQEYDVNMYCDSEVSPAKCQCKQDMKWRTEANECQIYLDVDCRNITYDTPPSHAVLEAANRTLEKLEKNEFPDALVKNNSDTSPSPNVTLENSLLSSIDLSIATESEITEAFCRDVDSFSWEFAEPKRELTLIEKLSENKWYIIIGVVAFLYLVFMGRNRIKQLWQTRCFTRPKPGNSEGLEGAVTYRGVVAVPAEQEHTEVTAEVSLPYPVKDPAQLPYPPQPDTTLPYPAQPDTTLPYPVQPNLPPPAYEPPSLPSSLPYPPDNKQPPYNPNAV